MEELKLIQGQRNKFNFRYDVIKGGITLGNSLMVMNQDVITDYVATSIKGLDSEIFDPQVIVNCHRQETISKCSEDLPQYFASPGCLCERHIIKTIKQIDFTEDKTVKMAFYGGFSKYRRMGHMNKYWTQGMIVVNVNKKGEHTITPCVIKKVGNEYATSYFNKIISSNGIHEPSNKIFIVGDMHAPNHDCNILDMQEQICKDYGADTLVNLGDAHDYRSLNHHDMERGKVILADLLKESAQTYHMLKRMTKWTVKKNAHIIVGNHERFGEDFIGKFPQLSNLLNFQFLCDLEGLGYKITDIKDVLHIGTAKFMHGEMVMYGQNGTKMEKASRTFGHDIFIGHIHYPAIRFGSYSVGFSALMDQGYNEANASSWLHGFGLCNQYKGINFPTCIAIINDKCILNNKTYTPKTPNAWKIKNYKAKLSYTTT
jgi:predicted phosphodiesterase